MEERLLLTLVIALGGAVLYLGFRLAHRERLLRGNPALPEDWQAGVPGVLYFASRTCSPCRAQNIAVERLGESLGRPLNLAKVDVEAQRELAGEWSVLTVPTTVVVDKGGKASVVNHGVVSEEKLRRQLEGVA